MKEKELGQLGRIENFITTNGTLEPKGQLRIWTLDTWECGVTAYRLLGNDNSGADFVVNLDESNRPVVTARWKVDAANCDTITARIEHRICTRTDEEYYRGIAREEWWLNARTAIACPYDGIHSPDAQCASCPIGSDYYGPRVGDLLLNVR